MKISFLTLLSLCTLTAAAQQAITIKNESYTLVADAQNITISVNGIIGLSRTLKPEITIVRSINNPLMAEKKSDNNLSPQVAWNNPTDMKNATAEQLKITPTAEFYQNTGNETDFYKVGKQITLKATTVRKSAEQLIFGFKDKTYGTVELVVSLPQGKEPPIIETRFNPLVKGWYSIGFTGIESQSANELDFLYQPMIWTWKRFPEKSYLSSEKFATTAATFTNNKKFTEGIAPDPTEIPYRFANVANSRFGLMLRNAEGKAQPLVFAPILGGNGSLLSPGKPFTFKTRYVLQPGDWYAGMNYILTSIFHYKNERKNAAVTLNQTLDNMIGIAMNDKSGGWVDSLKGFNYEQDAVGTVKVVSALHQLGTALVTGNEDIYAKRALPTMAYVMSREKYLYTTDERQKIQSPSHFLKGPCVEIGELSGLSQLTNGQTFAFQSEMNRLFGKTRKLNLNTETGGGTWQDYLYRYRVSKDPNDLQKAIAGADAYLKIWEPYPASFENDPGLRDKASAFMTDFAPKLYDMIEMYEETKDRKYLNLAQTAARQMVLWTRSNPMAPDSLLLVNKGGKVNGMAKKHYKINSKDGIPGFDYTTEIAEQLVPAWQTSLVGLPPEQPYTYGNGPIMLTQHPAWFLKLAALTQDTLLKTAAYNAILGRYNGFPGYYFTSLHTNVYQSADYAAHDFLDIKYNYLFHNHIFPHITLLIDFLVNDAYYRSNGKVDFPGIYAPGYAYLTSNVYGSKLGSIFGNTDLRLWLPANAIQSNTPALNHVMGIGKNDFYVVLMNTFAEKVQTELRLNPDVIHWTPEKEYKVTVYYANGTTGSGIFKNGLLNVDINAQALAAYKIHGLSINVPLFTKMDAQKVIGGETSFTRDENSNGLGTLTGMLINTFPQFSDAYIFTDKTEKDFKQVTLQYRVGKGEWQLKKDITYPFEFDVHLANPAEAVEYRLTAIDFNNQSVTGKTYTLQNKSVN